jgi:hypothetical protein
MLDMHAIGITPGAGLTLGAVGAGLPANDGASQAGVPFHPNGKAALKLWGMVSPTADTIAALQFLSQDMPDQQNGEYRIPGTANLSNILLEWDNLVYNKGLRQFYAGTNTGVTACDVFTVDSYKDVPTACSRGSRIAGKQVIPPVVTFGGALTAGAWGSLAYAPTKPLPNGRYDILGFRVYGITNVALIRFQHADFQGFSPGLPCVDSELISTTSWDKIVKDNLLTSQDGNQFVYMGDVLGEDCCPRFSCGNNTTGLQIQMLSCQTDTPVVELDLAQV